MSSNADLTHLHAKDCMDAAASSYQKLVKLLAKIRPELKPPEWTLLAPRAVEFCAARTKEAKAIWLDDNEVPQGRSVVKTTSLEDGGRSFLEEPDLNLEPVEEPAQLKVPTTPSAPLYVSKARAQTPDTEVQAMVNRIMSRLDGEAPGSGLAFFERFFQTLLTSPPERLPQELAPYFGTDRADPASDVMQKLLRMRAADRGFAGRPSQITPGMLTLPDAAVSRAPEQWRDLMVPVRDRGESVFVRFYPGTKMLLGIAVLRHAPYEVIEISAAEWNDRFIIKSVDVVTFH